MWHFESKERLCKICVLWVWVHNMQSYEDMSGCLWKLEAKIIKNICVLYLWRLMSIRVRNYWSNHYWFFLILSRFFPTWWSDVKTDSITLEPVMWLVPTLTNLIHTALMCRQLSHHCRFLKCIPISILYALFFLVPAQHCLL